METAAPLAPSARRFAVAHYEHGPGAASHEAWIEALEGLAIRIASAAGLDADAACFLGVALREAVMNALHHGAGREGPRVTVGFAVASGREVLLTVRDHGPGFDPAAVPDPLAPENLGRGRGRGILFMRRFSDEVSFLSPRGGGTVARLRKSLEVHTDPDPTTASYRRGRTFRKDDAGLDESIPGISFSVRDLFA